MRLHRNHVEGFGKNPRQMQIAGRVIFEAKGPDAPRAETLAEVFPKSNARPRCVLALNTSAVIDVASYLSNELRDGGYSYGNTQKEAVSEELRRTVSATLPLGELKVVQSVAKKSGGAGAKKLIW
jgi:hypothetical protein